MQEITNIKEIQKIEMDILQYFIGECNKANVKCTLGYGTLLGAVRHKGFIPWDDDIDLIMLREDYDAIEQYLIENPHPRYKLLTPKTNPDSIYPFMKIYDSYTYLEEDMLRINNGIGIFIDIFPFDGSDNDEKKRKEVSSLCRKLQLVIYSKQGIKTNKFFENILRYMALWYFKNKDYRKYIQRIDEIARSRKVNDYKYCDFIAMYNLRTPIIQKEWFNDIVMLEFESFMFPVIKEWHNMLTSDYGDYMVLPPIEKQVNYHGFRAFYK